MQKTATKGDTVTTKPDSLNMFSQNSDGTWSQFAILAYETARNVCRNATGAVVAAHPITGLPEFYSLTAADLLRVDREMDSQ